MIFVFGFNCHLCITSAPTVEEELITPYLGYADFVPVGVDIWDGSVSAVEEFMEDTGLDIPLLLMGSSFATDYSTVQDRIIVVDKSGNIAYKNSGAAGAVTHQVRPVLDEALGISAPNALQDANAGLINATVQPNPVNDLATLSFELNEPGVIRAALLAVDGRYVGTIFNGYLQAGAHTLDFYTGDLQKGSYFARITSGEEHLMIQLVKN